MNKRKEVIMCFQMPNDSYVGGIAVLINCYLKAHALFENNGYNISFLDWDKGKEIKDGKRKIIKYSFAAFNLLRKKLIQKKNAVVHIHTSRGYLFLRDIILGVYAKRILKANTVLTIHVGAFKTVFENIHPIFRKIAIGLLNHGIDKVVFLSESIQKDFLKNGLKPHKASVLYNFYSIEIDHIVLANKERLRSNDRLSLIYLGSIQREKGIMDLLYSMDMLPKSCATLNICGTLTDKSIKDEFYGLVSALGDRVVLSGYVEGEIKAKALLDADIMVLPSYHEGFPVSILEGMACGCALITTKVGALPEILDEDNVQWCSIRDPGSIASCILEFSSNRDFLEMMKKKNKDYVNKYSKEKHIVSLCKLYDSILLK